MAKDLTTYKGDLPVTHDRYHAVIGGNLFIFFDKNMSDLLPGHKKAIDGTVVEFLVGAVRALGPSDYKLSVLGLASASGGRDYNADLAGARAYNCAIYAVREFEKRQKTDPTLKGAVINPVTNVLGDDMARKDATILHLRGAQVDKQQQIFRSAVFRFTAGKLATHIEHPPSFVCNGEEAKRRAHALLAMDEPDMAPFPTPWGMFFVKKGQVWNPPKRLIVSANWQFITYLQDDTLWSVRTADFAREIMLDGMIDGMRRAKPMAEASKVVMEFIQGLLVGPLEAIAAKLIVLFMWAGAHPDLVKKGVNGARPAFDALRFINQRCPTLWGRILDDVEARVGKDLKAALIATVTNPGNIAFALGRILRGIGGLDKLFAGKASPGKTIAEITFGKIAFVLFEVPLLVTALHLPGGIVKVTEQQLKQFAKDIQQDFGTNAKISMVLDDPTARKIAEEVLGPGVKEEMERAKGPIDDFNKMLETFIKDMDEME